jgi:hypothetical protein
MKTQIHNFLGWWYSCSLSAAMGARDMPKLRLVIQRQQVHQPPILEHPASCRSSPLCFFISPLHDYQKILSSHLFYNKSYQHFSFFTTNRIINLIPSSVAPCSLHCVYYLSMYQALSFALLYDMYQAPQLQNSIYHYCFEIEQTETRIHRWRIKEIKESILD